MTYGRILPMFRCTRGFPTLFVSCPLLRSRRWSQFRWNSLNLSKVTKFNDAAFSRGSTNAARVTIVLQTAALMCPSTEVSTKFKISFHTPSPFVSSFLSLSCRFHLTLNFQFPQHHSCHMGTRCFPISPRRIIACNSSEGGKNRRNQLSPGHIPDPQSI